MKRPARSAVVAAALLAGGALLGAGCASNRPPVAPGGGAGPSLVFPTPRVLDAQGDGAGPSGQLSPDYARRDALVGVRPDAASRRDRLFPGRDRSRSTFTFRSERLRTSDSGFTYTSRTRRHTDH